MTTLTVWMFSLTAAGLIIGAYGPKETEKTRNVVLLTILGVILWMLVLAIIGLRLGIPFSSL